MKKELELLNAMDSSLDSSLSRFNEACNEIQEAKYIIAAGKISHMLQTIAASKPLTTFFKVALNGYNFLEHFDSARYRDENKRPYIKMPTSPIAQIRFAYCLFFAIDSDKLDLANLLHTFYTHENSANEEFYRFCQEVIAPFQENLNGILTGKLSMAEPEEKNETAKAETSKNNNTANADGINNNSEAKGETASVSATERTEKAPNTQNNDENETMQQLNRITVEIMNLANAAEELPETEREELLLICDSFVQALSFGEARTIRLMYISLKNTVKCSSLFRKLNAQYDELNRIMDIY